jgi:hypothetical protein
MITRHTFLNEWFSECEGNIEIRILPDGEQGFFSIDDSRGIDAFVSKFISKNVYFGLATRNGQGGTKANVLNVPGVWADIDFKNMPKERADKLIKECPLQPTFVVVSGGGYHSYWKFKEPTDNIEIVENINRQLAQFFESDPVHDVSRIFRLPDTFNYKYTPKRPVKVQAFNQNNQYNESDFEEHLPPLRHEGSSSQVTKPLGWQDELLKGVNKGQRNQTAARLAGRFFAKGLSQVEVLTSLEGWNLKNNPPLGSEELKGIVYSVDKTDKRNHPLQEDPLKFPDIISGVAGQFTKLYSATLEVPKSFLFMAFLTCLGSILSKSLKLNTEIDIEVRLFTLLLGQSADERKSTAIKKTVQFFKELLQHDFYVIWGVNSAEGLQKMFKKNPTLLMAIDELKALLNKCRIESSTLLPMITTLFESDTFEAHTKNSDILVDNASLSLLSASTIETYETVWHPSFTAIGFGNRIWITPGSAKKQFSFPVKIPEGEKDLIQQETVKILKLVGDGLEIDISPKGKEFFHQWYLGLDKSIHAKRLDGYALRFMALLAVNELKNEIDLETVEKAIALCNWQLKVRQLYDPIDADNAIAEMEERIRRYLKQGPLPERDLKRKLHRIIERSGTWCFTNAIKNLMVAKDIYSKKDEKTIFIHISD